MTQKEYEAGTKAKYNQDEKNATHKNKKKVLELIYKT